MLDWNKIVPIVVLAVVTIISFITLPLSSGIQEKLVLGIMSLCGIYGIGSGVRLLIDRMTGK